MRGREGRDGVEWSGDGDGDAVPVGFGAEVGVGVGVEVEVEVEMEVEEGEGEGEELDREEVSQRELSWCARCWIVCGACHGNR